MEIGLDVYLVNLDVKMITDVINLTLSIELNVFIKPKELVFQLISLIKNFKKIIFYKK